MTKGISIVLDDKEITKVRRLRVEKNTQAEADISEFEIDNHKDRYTKIFYETMGALLEVYIARGICFRGFVDTVGFSYFPEQTIIVAGRDYTGLLIDEIVSKDLARRFSGRTASQIVERIAQYYNFDSETDITRSVYYEEKLYAEGTSVWEVIRTLSEKEGFDAYVTKDKVIIFKKREVSSQIKRIFAMDKREGIVPNELKFDQDKTLSLALKVKVIGYNQKSKRRISYVAESSGRNRSDCKLVTVRDYTLKNKIEVRDRAEALLRDFSKDLTTGSLLYPVDEEMEPGDAIEIKKIEMANRYFVTDVMHNLDSSGFTTELRFASKVLTEAVTVEEA
jgi:phage protein D